MKELTLYLDETQKTKVIVKLKQVLTGKLRTEIVTHIKTDPASIKTQERTKYIEDLIKDGEKLEGMTDIQLGIKLLQKGFKVEEDNEEEYQRYLYKFAMIVIEKESINRIQNQELKKKIESMLEDETNELWELQDVETLESIVEFFRKKVNRAA